MIVALVVVALSSLASVVVLRLALRDMARTFGEIEARAAAERHVLAGRIQNPNLFPTAPLAFVPKLPGSDVPDAPAPMSGFEAAGRDVSDLPTDDLTAMFGPEFTNAS